jgi:hypothetical protein
MIRFARVVFLIALVSKCSFSGENVAPLNDSLYLSVPIVIDNVTVWPIYSSKQLQQVEDYTTLDQAQKQNLALVRETGAAAQTNTPVNGVAQPAPQTGVQVAPPIQNRAEEQNGQQRERGQQ